MRIVIHGNELRFLYQMKWNDIKSFGHFLFKSSLCCPVELSSERQQWGEKRGQLRGKTSWHSQSSQNDELMPKFKYHLHREINFTRSDDLSGCS